MYALNVKSNLVGIGLKTSVPTQGGERKHRLPELQKLMRR